MQVPADATCVVVQNVEGVPDSEAADFSSITRFAVGDDEGWPLLAYINGKSAGRVGACAQHGPHRFTGVEWQAPLEAACVLHFESCPYSRWAAKFTHYAATTSRPSKIPFQFYVDSIECCRKHVAVRVRALAPAGPPAAGPTGAPCVAQEPSRLRSFWRKRKMRHYLREAETVLTISHLGLAPEVRERLTRQRRRGLRASRAQTTLWLSEAPSD